MWVVCLHIYHNMLYDYIMNHHEYHMEVLEIELVAATERVQNKQFIFVSSTISLKYASSWVHPTRSLDY